MNHPSLRLWVAIAASVVVPGIALAFPMPIGDGPRPAVTSPFGWWSLLVCHMLASLPLSMSLASLVRPSWGRAVTGGVLAALGLFATVAFGAAVGILLEKGQAGFEGRLAVRALWCVALQTPVCFLLTPGTVRLTWPQLLLGGAIATAPPAIFAHALCASSTKQVGELLGSGRYALALTRAEPLCQVGSGVPVEGQPCGAFRARLGGEVRRLRALSDLPFPSAPPATAAVERARALAMLDRFDEAAGLLGNLPEARADARLLLGSVRQKQRRYQESSAAFRSALNLGEAREDERVRVYDGLAFNAREVGDYAEAERVYHEALARFPDQAAHFHFQLGRHHEQGGRPGLAVEHLSRAAILDEARFGTAVRDRIARLRRSTPGCLLRLPTSGTAP